MDNGPIAGLSNQELVSKAITNMQALSSYHLPVVQRSMSDSTATTPWDATSAERLLL